MSGEDTLVELEEHHNEVVVEVTEESRRVEQNSTSSSSKYDSPGQLSDLDVDKIFDFQHSAINENQLTLLKHWLRKADLGKKKNIKEGRKKKWFAKWLNLAIEIIVYFLGGSSIINSFQTKDPYNIAFAVMTSVASVLQIIQKASNPGRKAEQFSRIAQQYNNFGQEKRNALSQGIDDRADKINIFMIKTNNELQAIESEELTV